MKRRRGETRDSPERGRVGREREKKPAGSSNLTQRNRKCPFSGKEAPQIDYKDVKLLRRFVSEQGKITPARVTFVSAKKQRELALAVKRARFLALLPYEGKGL
ncbi:MAG: 30S ribosomal protein S18 [Holosporales bacterium]|jgi:small subunit ribosomal protein S18|nr:30S ribosomal protein S18 [Holosporales bacterium]